MAEIFEKERDTRLGWYFRMVKNRAGEPESKSQQHEVFKRRLEAAAPRPTPAMVRLRQRHEAARMNEDGGTTTEQIHPEPEADGDIGATMAVQTTTGDDRMCSLPPIDMYKVRVAIVS